MDFQSIVFQLSSKKLGLFTLIYLRSKGKVLLLKRSPQKDLVAGKWLGLGGKLEPGEDLFDSARREFLEETGLRIDNPILRGSFTWVNESSLAGMIYIFTATDYEGNLLKNCDEGELSWHNIDNVDKLDNLAGHQKFFLSKMLKDDSYFYSGIGFYNNEKILKYIDNKKYFKDRKK